MRTVLAVTIALALVGPSAALAAGSSPTNDLSQLVSAYQRIQSVRVVEKFENGAVATVDVIPSGQFRIASTGGQDPALIVKIATQPVDGVAVSNGSYNVLNTGKKTIDGAKTTGYRIMAPDGTYDATVWVNEYHLPVASHVLTQGHSIDVTYGDYNDSALIATP
jgi:hypothetical protein